jgi:hypothetical protein
VQQIAVRQMQLDGVEAAAHRALRAVDKSLAHPHHVIFVHGARRVPAGAERQRRRRDGLPRVFVRAERLGAFPRPLRRRLAAGMRKLDAELGLADALAMQNHPLERVLAAVRIDPHAAMGDAAVPLDMGRFQHQKAGAGIRQHAEMGHVPFIGDAIIGGILAHRRDDDAVR